VSGSGFEKSKKSVSKKLTRWGNPPIVYLRNAQRDVRCATRNAVKDLEAEILYDRKKSAQ